MRKNYQLVSSQELAENPALQEMMNAGFSPEVVRMTLDAINRAKEYGIDNLDDEEEISGLVFEAAEFEVGSMYDEDIYPLASDAELHWSRAIQMGLIPHLMTPGDVPGWTLCDCIRGGLTVAISIYAGKAFQKE